MHQKYEEKMFASSRVLAVELMMSSVRGLEVQQLMQHSKTEVHMHMQGDGLTSGWTGDL